MEKISGGQHVDSQVYFNSFKFGLDVAVSQSKCPKCQYVAVTDSYCKHTSENHEQPSRLELHENIIPQSYTNIYGSSLSIIIGRKLNLTISIKHVKPTLFTSRKINYGYMQDYLTLQLLKSANST